LEADCRFRLKKLFWNDRAHLMMRNKMTKEERKLDSSVIVFGDDSERDLAN
jgi:hypothetical protein